MVVTFPDTEFGRIECERERDGTATAYFFARDEEYSIDKEGFFRDFNGLMFRVNWPSEFSRPSDASLEVFQPRTIARVTLSS